MKSRLEPLGHQYCRALEPAGAEIDEGLVGLGQWVTRSVPRQDCDPLIVFDSFAKEAGPRALWTSWAKAALQRRGFRPPPPSPVADDGCLRQ